MTVAGIHLTHQVISSPPSAGRQKFFVLQPNKEGRVETVGVLMEVLSGSNVPWFRLSLRTQ